MLLCGANWVRTPLGHKKTSTVYMCYFYEFVFIVYVRIRCNTKLLLTVKFVFVVSSKVFESGCIIEFVII